MPRSSEMPPRSITAAGLADIPEALREFRGAPVTIGELAEAAGLRPVMSVGG